MSTKKHEKLSAWERVAICRHPSRPKALDYISNLCQDYVELSGDRLFRDDPAICAGLGMIDGQKFMVIAQEKGYDTETRLKRNFGMPHPEGYRKALRCMRLAAKFHLPVLSFLDTPGAYAGLAAEERGQGWAIANNLLEMSRLPTPIIIVLIGEGCSGGALGMGIGDSIAMLEHSYYSVISPEGCASILWKDASKKQQAAEVLKMHPEYLLEMEIIDHIINEPHGGAHHDVASTYARVKEHILSQWNVLKAVPTDDLLERRFAKFRKMGKCAIREEEVLCGRV